MPLALSTAAPTSSKPRRRPTLDDLLAQARETLAAAQRGALLPDDFKFGSTDNNTTASFGQLLSSTSTKLK